MVDWRKYVAFFGQLGTKSITVTGWTASTTSFTASSSLFCICISPGVPPLFFFFFKSCMARRRWRVWGQSWTGSCPDSWAEGWLTPSPGPTCTLWAPTRHGPAPAWRWCYWFAAEEKLDVTEHLSTVLQIPQLKNSLKESQISYMCAL